MTTRSPPPLGPFSSREEKNTHHANQIAMIGMIGWMLAPPRIIKAKAAEFGMTVGQLTQHSTRCCEILATTTIQTCDGADDDTILRKLAPITDSAKAVWERMPMSERIATGNQRQFFASLAAMFSSFLTPEERASHIPPAKRIMQ